MTRLSYHPAIDEDPLGWVGQTAALLRDSYRQLAASRVFWLTLVLSGAVAAVFAFVGITERGIVVFGFNLPGAWNANLLPPADFYRYLFTNFAIPWWLGVFASALALVSVAGIFPDLLTGGSLELYVSKPISRVRLFAIKYLGGLLFVAAQVTLFTAVAFVVIGIRGGAWEWRIFLAVPIVTLFFSYLFAICVLVGVLTRSTLAALLVTILAWGGLFLLSTSDRLLLQFVTAAEQRVEDQQARMRGNEELITRNAALPIHQQSNVSAFQFQLDAQRQKQDEYVADLEELQWWHRLVRTVRAPLPRTGETLLLLDRWLLEADALAAVRAAAAERRDERRRRRGFTPGTHATLEPGSPAVLNRVDRIIESRSIGEVIGTSLAFELSILAIAAAFFARRDY
jgi:ABC-type transport system involved in multi-copper enzyme maturation permease subunit